MALAAASTRRLSEGLRAVVTILYASAGTFIMRLTTVSMGGVASKLWYRVQLRKSWWGGPPGPHGTPSSRNRYNDISILQGASRPTGASAADPGVRPTINTGVVTGKSMWHWARLPAPHLHPRGNSNTYNISFSGISIPGSRSLWIASVSRVVVNPAPRYTQACRS